MKGRKNEGTKWKEGGRGGDESEGGEGRNIVIVIACREGEGGYIYVYINL